MPNDECACRVALAAIRCRTCQYLFGERRSPTEGACGNRECDEARAALAISCECQKLRAEVDRLKAELSAAKLRCDHGQG
jgi:hypothetical protein